MYETIKINTQFHKRMRNWYCFYSDANRASRLSADGFWAARWITVSPRSNDRTYSSYSRCG